MRSFIAGFFVAMLVAVLMTPIMRRLGLRIGAVSHPGGRNIHARVVPRIGGVGIALAFFTPLIALFFVESSVAEVFRQAHTKAIGLILGGCIMCLVGFVDDTRRLRAVHKLAAQVLVALVAFACGFDIHAVSLPIVGTHSMGVFALPVTVVWIVGIVNAVNLIDGLDGLAAGVVVFAGITNFVVACVTGSLFVGILMACMIGALIGFLFYNFNPARIFMGDSGSYFLGFVLAATSLSGAASQKTSTAVALLAPIVALGVPIFDTLFAMVRRILERRSIFSPDRGHIHHRLLDMGITHKRAVLLIYSVSILFAASAIGIALGTSWQVGVALLGATVVLVGLVRFLGYFEYLHRNVRRERIRSSEVEQLRKAIPMLSAALANARTEDDVVAAVRAAGKTGGAVEVVARTRDVEGPSLRPLAAVVNGVDVVCVRCPIGAPSLARAEIEFSWDRDQSAMSGESELLLQVMVDLALPHLTRLRSDLAPRLLEDSGDDLDEAVAPAAARPSQV